MKKFCALIPLLAALPAFALTFAGCAGTKPVQSLAGEGGSGATVGETGGSVGNGGSVVTGTGGGVSTTGSGGDVGMSDAGDPNCGLLQFKPTPKAADILMVLDRSGSMIDIPDGAPTGSTTTKWQIVVPSLEAVVSATESSIAWGMKSFPEAYSDSLGTDCAGGITGIIDVKVAATDGTQMNSAITALTPAGKGTPTADAINSAVTYMGTLTDTNPKYLLLATDGEPTCVGTTKDSSGSPIAGPAAVAAIANALKAGFPTFVVGIATTKTTANTELTAMSKAGGEPVPVTNPLAHNYYLANDATTLVSAMEAITGQISTCLFPLSPAPPVRDDPTKVGVYVGSSMTRIPYDATNGWTYTDTTDSALEVHGSWCNMIQAAGAGAVQIIYGCPSINPPG